MFGLQLDCGPGVDASHGTEDGGFDWTDLWDDIQQTLSPPASHPYPTPKTPNSRPNRSPPSFPCSQGGFSAVFGFGEDGSRAREDAGGEGFSWLDLWDDINGGPEGEPASTSVLPPTPESLQRPTQDAPHPPVPGPSTPTSPAYSIPSYADPYDPYAPPDDSFPSSLPSLVASQSSPASYHLRTPRSDPPNHRPSPSNADHRPLLPSYPSAPPTPGGWDDNPFLAKRVVTPTPSPRKRKRPQPQWRTGLEVPADWAEDDTPTPMRFLAEGYGDVPRQPVFEPVSPVAPTPTHVVVAAKAELPQAAVLQDLAPPITWITHLSTDGGLPLSLQRLKSLPSSISQTGTAPGPHVISGASLFISHPKRRVPELSERSATAAGEFCKAMQGMGEGFARRSMAHGVHTVNLLSADPEMRKRSKASVISEMEWARELGIPTLVIHLGSGGNDTSSTSRKRQVRRLIDDLREIIAAVPEVTLALENTVHPSPTSPTTLTSLISLLPSFPPGRLKLCLDLCHLHVCEFDLNSPSGRAGLFAQLEKAGWGSVVGVHASDSYVTHGGKGDRHANLGFGHIHLSAFREILSHPFFANIPHLLETPRYFKHFRSTSSPHSLLLSHLEAERAGLERALLQWVVGAAENEWIEGGGGGVDADGRGKVWAEYKKRKKRVENKIYKILLKRGGTVWARFKKGRKKHVGCCRVVEGVKRREKRCVKNVGQAAGEGVSKAEKGQSVESCVDD
ncbi:hypothetical protein IAT38_002567 [Cryptococcus sp. DSM 104549]